MNIDELREKFQYGSRWSVVPGAAIDETIKEIVVWGFYTFANTGVTLIADQHNNHWDPDDLTPVPDTPTVADQWGYLVDGRFNVRWDEEDARDAARITNSKLARIVNGVVCKEDGTPFIDDASGNIAWVLSYLNEVES